MAVLLRGGHVIDPSNELNKNPCDVLIDGDRIIKVGEDLPLPEGAQSFDASGCLVCPGLVDMHVHCFPGGTLLGVDPDEWCLKRGVTTVVDAGSAGNNSVIMRLHSISLSVPFICLSRCWKFRSFFELLQDSQDSHLLLSSHFKGWTRGSRMCL